VDIMIYPNGTVMPTTLYSNASSFGMGSAYYHFWLAERADLFDPVVQQNVPYLLPMVPSSTNGYPSGSARYLKGERLLLTLYTRTGQMVTNQVEQSSFDGSGTWTAAPNLGGASQPYLLPQQGVRGDTR
jgi:hypothetical protein